MNITKNFRFDEHERREQDKLLQAANRLKLSQLQSDRDESASHRLFPAPVRVCQVIFFLKIQNLLIRKITAEKTALLNHTFNFS